MEPVEITDRAASQIARGVLWIFSNEIFKKPAALEPGAWSEFHCRSKAIATGYCNPHSLIFGRVAALGSVADVPALLKKRLEAAFTKRSALSPRGAARLVFSEADFLPGLIVDVYSDNVVLQSNTAGIDRVLGDLENLIPDIFEQVFRRKLNGLVIRADSGIRRLEGVEDFTKVALGTESALAEASFEEDGTLIAADLVHGQKTGFFLDQRDNRTFLAKQVSSGKKRVLDLCCYSGGWGLRALKSGAEHVTFVDENKDALALLERGLALNGINKSRVRIVQSDIFDFLENDAAFYDAVVADPPAFVKSKKNLPQALKAYEKLNRLAWRRLQDKGVLITCTCSYHLAESEFMELLTTAVAKEKGLALVAHRGGQASDHPILLSMPETHYLKCVGLQKVSF